MTARYHEEPIVRQQAERVAHEIFDEAKEELEAAYEEERSDEDAVAMLEDGKELIKYLHGEADKIDIEQYAMTYDIDLEDDRLESYSDYRIDPGSSELDEFYDAVKERFDPGDIDYVVGVFSGGIPTLYAATEHIDAEEVVMRYSHFTRNDTDVMTTDTMEERAAFEDADVLIVDDVISSGRTIGMVGEEILEDGSDNVYAISSRVRSDIGDKYDVFEVTDDEPGLLERLTGLSVTVNSSPVGTSIDVNLGGGKEAADVRLQQASGFSP